MSDWSSEIADVVAGQPVESAWGNEIRNKVVHVVATDASLPDSVSDGAICYVEDEDEFYRLIGGVWVLDSTFTAEAPTLLVYESSGSFVKATYPTAIWVRVRLVGGGGGGGGAAASDANTSGGGGGGGGGYAEAIIPVADLGASTTVTIGGGGDGGGVGEDGDDGGDTTFAASGGSLVGGGGGAGSGGAAFSGFGYTYEGPGGSASGGDINLPGEAGGRVACTPSPPRLMSLGHGGAAGGGLGGQKRDWSNSQVSANGSNGQPYGGGGAGGYKNNTSGTITGGNGADGVCIVEVHG